MLVTRVKMLFKFRLNPRILRKNKANRAALVSFFKIMLKKLRLLPERSINYMSDIWANGISYFQSDNDTLSMNSQITEN